LGYSRKYPYTTTDGFNLLTPLAFGNSKMPFPPLALGIPVQRTLLALGIPKSRPLWCMDYFLELPIIRIN